MKNTIQRDKLGAVIAPHHQGREPLLGQPEGDHGQEQGRGPRPGRDRLEVGA